MRQPRAESAEPAPSGLARGADQAACFTDLVEIERTSVFRLVRRLLGEHEGVEDVVQDVFTKAWLNWDQVARLDRPGAWLMRVAINTCRARMRRLRLWRAFLRQTRPVDVAPATDAAGADEARIRAALASLGHADREVLVLRYLEELPVEDLCRLLDLNRSAVDARLSRARRRLGLQLGDGDA